MPIPCFEGYDICNLSMEIFSRLEIKTCLIVCKKEFRIRLINSPKIRPDFTIVIRNPQCATPLEELVRRLKYQTVLSEKKSAEKTKEESAEKNADETEE